MDSCWDNASIQWNRSHVSSAALHNLSYHCPASAEQGVSSLDAPSTFFIQLFRLSICFALFTCLLTVYNCVNVLERNLFTTATCSVFWILMMTLAAIKSGVLMVFVPVAHVHSSDTAFSLNQAGFLSATLLQCAVVCLLLLALEHEYKFRSPDYASIDSAYQRHCVTLSCRKVLCSKGRLLVLAVSAVPLLLIAATEIALAVSTTDTAPSALVWVLFISLLVPRFGVVVMVILLVGVAKGTLKPTVLAKVVLVTAVLLSLLEEIPPSFWNVAPFTSSENCSAPCVLHVMTLYDLFQLLGGFSFLFYAAFVRSQYLRVEQECKLALVWDLQKLMQVNGQKDVTAE